MTFAEVLLESAMRPELVKQYDKVFDGHMGKIINSLHVPVYRMINEVTGFQQEELRKFTNFVYEYVWLPLILENKYNG